MYLSKLPVDSGLSGIGLCGIDRCVLMYRVPFACVHIHTSVDCVNGVLLVQQGRVLYLYVPLITSQSLLWQMGTLETILSTHHIQRSTQPKALIPFQLRSRIYRTAMCVCVCALSNGLSLFIAFNVSVYCYLLGVWCFAALFIPFRRH